MLCQHLLEGISQVAKHVPAIGHLQRLGSTARCAFGIGPCPIAANDLDLRLRFQPGGKRVGTGIGQAIDHLVLLQIDQDGTVRLAFPVRIELSRPVTEPARLQNRA